MLTKVHIVKAVGFPVVMYGCESWTVKKAEHQRTDAFELWCWRRLLRVPWTARKSNQSTLKEINPEYSLEGLMLKLKFQYFGYLMLSWLIGKDPNAGKDWGQKEKVVAEEETISITDTMDVNFSKLQEMVKDREAWHALVHGVTKNQTRVSDWTPATAKLHVLPFENMHNKVFDIVSIYRWKDSLFPTQAGSYTDFFFLSLILLSNSERS